LPSRWVTSLKKVQESKKNQAEQPNGFLDLPESCTLELVVRACGSYQQGEDHLIRIEDDTGSLVIQHDRPFNQKENLVPNYYRAIIKDDWRSLAIPHAILAPIKSNDEISHHIIAIVQSEQWLRARHQEEEDPLDKAVRLGGKLAKLQPQIFTEYPETPKGKYQKTDQQLTRALLAKEFPDLCLDCSSPWSKCSCEPGGEETEQ